MIAMFLRRCYSDRIDHHTGKVLAYVFGRRKDTVLVELKALLEPFGITRYFTDGWGAYERHVEAEQHTVGKVNTQKDREQTHQLAHADQAVSTSDDLLFQDGTHARLVIGLFINRYEFGLAI